MAVRGKFMEKLSDPPVAGWTVGRVSLLLERSNERPEVEAWIRGPFAIHDLYNGRANVTHIPTGRRVYDFDNKLLACDFVERVEKLGNWSDINQQEAPGSELYKKVRPIIDEFLCR